jgi:hypothetical protein
MPARVLVALALARDGVWQAQPGALFARSGA